MSRLAAAIAAASLALLAACGGGGDDLRSQMKSTMGDLVETLEGIETVEDAKAAKGKLQAIAEKAKAQQAKVEALPAEEQEKLKVKDDEIKELEARMKKAMMNLITKPELASEMGGAMEALGQ